MNYRRKVKNNPILILGLVNVFKGTYVITRNEYHSLYKYIYIANKNMSTLRQNWLKKKVHLQELKTSLENVWGKF